MPGKRKGLSCQEDALSAQELSQLLMACETLRDRYIIDTLVLGGLRPSELKHLHRSWVNLEEGTITIPRRQYCSCHECLTKRGGIWRPKTKKGARTIIINPYLQPVLEQFFRGYEELGLTRQRIWQRVKELAKKAHIYRNLYPHCMRATGATISAYDGMSAATLQYNYGWERLSSAESYVKSDMKRAHVETKEIYAKKT